MFDLVALDADDTLWHNEPFYRTTRDRFCELLGPSFPPDLIDERLYETERKNLEHFGYGVKGFVLSLLETALDLTGGQLPGDDVRKIVQWGREMLAHPVELLDGVRDAVEDLARAFPLVLVTKGDLFHQESKLARSKLGHLFRGVEIVSEKDADTYRRVMSRYGVAPDRFVMAGNSLRSDVLPVLEAGGHAVLVPYEMSWVHERVAPEALADLHFHQVAHIRELAPLLRRLNDSGPPDDSPSNPVARGIASRDVRAEIEEIVARETRAWDTRDVDLLLSVLHPDMVWPWPPGPDAHDPMKWVLVLGRYDRERWRRGWQALFDTHELVHNERQVRRIEVSAEGDGALAVVDVDTLWRSRAGVDQHWVGRACKIYTRVGNEWKMIGQTGLLDYSAWPQRWS